MRLLVVNGNTSESITRLIEGRARRMLRDEQSGGALEEIVADQPMDRRIG